MLIVPNLCLQKWITYTFHFLTGNQSLEAESTRWTENQSRGRTPSFAPADPAARGPARPHGSLSPTEWEAPSGLKSYGGCSGLAS